MGRSEICILQFHFGHSSQIVEMTVGRYSEHRRPQVTIESEGTRRRYFAFIKPEPLADLSSLMNAWAVSDY